MTLENDNLTATHAPRPAIGRGFWGVLAVTVVAVGLVGAFAQNAISGESGWRAQMFESRHGGRMVLASAIDEANVDEQVERMVAHLSIEIDATADQQQKINAIATDAAHKLLALRGEFGQRGETANELIDLLSGPSIDRNAVEELRAEKLDLADQASKVVTQALVDVADILTVEQREEIGDKLEKLVKLRQSFHR